MSSKMHIRVPTLHLTLFEKGGKIAVWLSGPSAAQYGLRDSSCFVTGRSTKRGSLSHGIAVKADTTDGWTPGDRRDCKEASRSPFRKPPDHPRVTAGVCAMDHVVAALFVYML